MTVAAASFTSRSSTFMSPVAGNLDGTGPADGREHGLDELVWEFLDQSEEAVVAS